jgi:hypothetical protein
MSEFRAIGVTTELARRVRALGRDPFGGRAEVRFANDAGFPCRHCLKEARINSQVLLISYQPLIRETPFAGRGPIFICAEDCSSFEYPHTVPEIVMRRQINLRAYDKSGAMLYAYSRLISGDDAKRNIAETLQSKGVHEVHAHTALHGCFLCKFVRAQDIDC